MAFTQESTTTPDQFYAFVGGTEGANIPASKSLVGAFHHPKVVLIDTETLRTLPRRELSSGWCEAVKQGAAGDRRLFDKTVRLLRRRGVNFSLRSDPEESQTEVCATIAAHCRFKASSVAGDEREEIW